jgi:chromate reductase, NAD(P)H dehydrogenase (quinone)
VPDLTLLGISGSLRAGSHNTRLLRAAGRELPEGVRLRLYDGLREIPPYDEDADGTRLRRRWRACATSSRAPTGC